MSSVRFCVTEPEYGNVVAHVQSQHCQSEACCGQNVAVMLSNCGTVVDKQIKQTNVATQGERPLKLRYLA